MFVGSLLRQQLFDGPFGGADSLVRIGTIFSQRFLEGAIMKSWIGTLVLGFCCSQVLAADKDIVDTAVSAGSFQTLVAAVKAADLVEVLKSKGPFTVLAPTDEAFKKLPEGTVQTLLKPENKEKLVAILKYHVIPSKAMAADVVKLSGKKVKTVEGSEVAIEAGSSGVKVNNANVVKTDIECTNGVIHVIDSVILPPEKK